MYVFSCDDFKFIAEKHFFLYVDDIRICLMYFVKLKNLMEYFVYFNSVFVLY